MDVLYEDNHLIAVNKPHGMLVQGDVTGDPSLINEVRYFIKQRDNKPGNVFVGLLHRLDRPVGGVVLFGKTSKGAARLSEQFRQRTIGKLYWAVVERKTGDRLKPHGQVIHWLSKDEDANRVSWFDEDRVDTWLAETKYRILAEKDGLALVELSPQTGRPHQLRAAMASLGAPIVGDVKYGGANAIVLPNGSTALALFARLLSFDQPVTKERVTVTAEPVLDIFTSFA